MVTTTPNDIMILDRKINVNKTYYYYYITATITVNIFGPLKFW